MIKLIYALRFIINPILSLKIFNNKFFLSFLKKIYSFFFTRSGIKNVKKYVVEIDDKIQPVLKKWKGYIGCGNCLFLARGQEDFGKNDIDYCVEIRNERDANELIKDLESHGFKLTNKLFFNKKIIELKFSYKKTYFDVFLLYKIDNKYVNSYTILLNKKFPKICKINDSISLINCTVVNQKWVSVKQTIKKPMFNHMFLIPKNYEDYLNLQYGFDWRTPKPDFNFLIEPENNPPKLFDDQGIIMYTNA